MINTYLNEKQLETFLASSSHYGLKSLYIIKLSFEKRIAFIRADVGKQIFSDDGEYFYGYVVACSVLKFFKMNVKNYVITISDLDPFFSSKIDIYIENFRSQSESNKKEIEAIEKYFTT